jgi:cyclophilin family peptidyl-prolyl cis-trans isomerase/HEAT repeat protein
MQRKPNPIQRESQAGRSVPSILLALLWIAGCGGGNEGPVPDARLEATILQAEDRRDPGPIRSYLADSDPRTRRRAALALGRIGDLQDVPELGALLHDPDPSLRARAAFALGLVGSTTAVEPLLGAVDDPDEDVRQRVAAALTRIQGAGAGAALLPLLSEAEGADAVAALYGAWRLQDPELVVFVLDRAGDPDPEIRGAAVYSLMRMVGPPGAGATPVPGGTEFPGDLRNQAAARLVEMTGDEDPRIRELAARGLGGGDLPGAAEALVALLDDPSWGVRVNAARSLGRLGEGFDPEVLRPLLADPSANVRLAAVQALASTEGTEALAEKLEGMIVGDELPMRLAAASALAAWEGEDSYPRALAMSGDPDPQVRASAAGILGPIQGGAARARLREMLTDPSPLVVGAALSALAGRENTDRVALGLVVAQEHEDPVVRAAAVGVLPREDAGIVEPLGAIWSRARDDAQNDARMAMARALAEVPGEEAELLLERIAREDPDWRVRREAAAGMTAPLAVGPLETGRALAEYEVLVGEGEIREVLLTLDRGTIRLELYPAVAPLTVESFLGLVEAGYFDGITFHRVVPNFVIQGGDPRGDGSGGPGYQIRCEINTLSYERGTVGMALDGKDTGGSQFFITHTPQPHLDGLYTVFGRVADGMNVVDAVVQGDVILEARVIR